MDSPCFKKPSNGCAADVLMATQDATVDTEEFDPTEMTDDSEDSESEGSDAIELAKRDNAAGTDFEAFNHGGGHRDRHHHHSRYHHHGKHYHHDKHQHHDKHPHHNKHSYHHKEHSLKQRHPWKDLCVAVGDFCGSGLYGCDFNHKALYRCSAIGERPAVIKVDAEECGGSPPVKCPCPADFVHAACGSELPEKCNADPTQLYHCPGGPGSEFEVLKKCLPGTVCGPSKEGNDATCGYESCECNGDKDYCSSQFPAHCDLKKNTIYKCVRGKLTEDKTCDGTTQECVAVGDGAICGSCKCPSDRGTCGDVFPLKCRRSATGLYKCKKGETPKLVKECLPGYCSAAPASLSSTTVFESEISKDVCIEGCLCVKKGDVCGRTFSPECKDIFANRLYMCSGVGTKPVEKEICEDGCIVQAGDDVCEEDNDPCRCMSSEDVCGSTFPPECKDIFANRLYTCSGVGTKPEEKEICEDG
ncbi:hypothetical protein BG015_004109, partial [Linnemannia schmuckeri]